MDEQQKRVVSPITLFYSYAHEDERLRNELEKHLSLLHRQGLISEWYDRQILAGDEWAADIDQHLETASIILLLISSDFLASNYCYDIEMKRALERHQRGEARVIPILLRPCDWRTSPFARLQCLPHDGKAVTTWQNSDEAFLTIAQELRRVIAQQQIPTRPLSRVEQQNRTRLMKRMRAIWIEGVLEHSLHQAALIALDLQEQPDALANPWQLEVQETNVPPHLLPAGTPLVQVYDEAEGELLILGEPGAGKTTLLLQLASDLLKRAEQESTFPMPVIFTLSSWAEKRLSLPDWLIEELFTKYQVPRNVGRSWVENDQLLLLLDGLDEVTQVHRSACLQAINAYRQEHNLVSLVLCSRKAEYEAQSTRVTLSRAVVIQPLTLQQIDDYLTQAGPQLEAVHSLLRQDQELQELARTPLMLTILALSYQGKTVDDLVMRLPPDVQRHQVLGTYVERMLQRRAVSHYTPEQTKCWLAWLARQMAQQSQSTFFIERMQPSWLPTHLTRWGYHIVIGLLIGLLCLSVALLAGLILGLSSIKQPSGLIVGLTAGLIIGLVSGLTSGLRAEIKPAESVTWSWKKALWGYGGTGLVVGWPLLLVLLPTILLDSTLVSDLWGLPPLSSLIMRIFLLRIMFFVSLLLLPLPIGLINGLCIKIKPFAVAWSWKRVLWGYSGCWLFSFWLFMILSSLFSFLLILLLIGLINGLRIKIKPFTVAWSWKRVLRGELVVVCLPALLAALFGGPLFGLFFGLSGNTLEEHLFIRPNGGIWRSARNSIRYGAVVALTLVSSVLLIIMLIYTWLNRQHPQYWQNIEQSLVPDLLSSLPVVLSVVVIVVLIVGLSAGGLACIQHIVLRVFLQRAKSIPWNYPQFLDYAAERVLLRKVGGGYIFIHRLLLDYFASLKTSSSEGASPGSASLQKANERG